MGSVSLSTQMENTLNLFGEAEDSETDTWLEKQHKNFWHEPLQRMTEDLCSLKECLNQSTFRIEFTMAVLK